jgi:excisionase family DNA binding protein
MEHDSKPTTPLAYTINDAVKVSGLSRTKLYELASTGRLSFRRCGRRTVILADDLRALLENLPPAQIRIKSAA